MTTDIKEDVANTVFRILEDWGMMMVEPPGENASFSDHDQTFVATLRFSGPIQGYYSVLCQEPFAKQLAANVLGREIDEIHVGEELEVLKELINVLSGNLLTISYGDELAFALTTPDVRVANYSELKKAQSSPRKVTCIGDSVPVIVTYGLDE